MPKIRLYKILMYAITLIVLVFLLYSVTEEVIETNFFSKANIENLVTSAGVWSWLVYILLVASISLSFFPSSALGVVAGYIFNPYLAVLLTVIGEFIGAFGNYMIGKKIIGHFINKNRLPKISREIDKLKGTLTPYTIFLLGVVPVSTTNITAYTAALSGVKLKNYIFPWTAGISLLSTFTILLGHSASVYAPNLSYLTGLIVLLLIIFVFWKLKNI